MHYICAANASGPLWSCEWKIVALVLILKRLNRGVTVLLGFANKPNS